MPSRPPENSAPPSPLELLEASPPTREMWAAFVEIVKPMGLLFGYRDGDPGTASPDFGLRPDSFPLEFSLSVGDRFMDQNVTIYEPIKISSRSLVHNGPVPMYDLELEIADRASGRKLLQFGLIYSEEERQGPKVVKRFRVISTKGKSPTTAQLKAMVQSLVDSLKRRSVWSPGLEDRLEVFDHAVRAHEHPPLLKLSTELMMWLKYLHERLSSKGASKEPVQSPAGERPLPFFTGEADVEDPDPVADELAAMKAIVRENGSVDDLAALERIEAQREEITRLEIDLSDIGGQLDTMSAHAQTEQFRADYVIARAGLRIYLEQSLRVLQQCEAAIREASDAHGSDDDFLADDFPKIQEDQDKLSRKERALQEELAPLKRQFNTLKEAFGLLPRSRNIPSLPDEREELLNRANRLKEEAKTLSKTFKTFFHQKIAKVDGLQTQTVNHRALRDKTMRLFYRKAILKPLEDSLVGGVIGLLSASLVGAGTAVYATDLGDTWNLHLSPRTRAQHAILVGGVPTDISLRHTSYAPVDHDGNPLEQDDLLVGGVYSTLEEKKVKLLWGFSSPSCGLDDHYLPHAVYDYYDYRDTPQADSPFVGMSGYETFRDLRFNAVPMGSIAWREDNLPDMFNLPPGFEDATYITVTNWGCPVFWAAVDSFSSLSGPKIGHGAWIDLYRLNTRPYSRARVYPSFLLSDNCVFWFEKEEWNEGEWLGDFMDFYQ